MRILITGGEGQLARALVATRPRSVEVWAPRRSVLDISSNEQLVDVLDHFGPDVVINTAAYTAVDDAEDHPELANAVNADAVGQLGTVCSARGTRVIHISTDYVFDGEDNKPYGIDAVTNPINVYGKSKLAGEQLLLQSGENHLVMRSSWLYSIWGHNFFRTMRRKMLEGKPLKVVDDQIGTPTSVMDLARACWSATELPDLIGIAHWTNSGQASWYEFAVAIAELLQLQGALDGPVSVEPIRSSEYQMKAKRPRNSVLDCGDTYAALSTLATAWPDALAEIAMERRI